MAEQRKRSFWGWGYEDQQPNAEQLKHMAERMAKRFGLAPLVITPPPREDELNLRAPRIKPPDALAAIFSTSTYDRAGHSYGRSYRDVVRAFRRHYPNPFDAVPFRTTRPSLLAYSNGATRSISRRRLTEVVRA
jgi:alkyldihydroxyacetonephosphate synthase